MTARLMLRPVVAAALAILLLIPLGRARAGPVDATDHPDNKQSEHDSGSGQIGNKPASSSPVSQINGAPEKKTSEPSSNTNCGMLETVAVRYGLPTGFFRRLIRQESNFDPKAVSHAGAMGIAQFMPGTARWRGLSDPFEPNQALNESARWLSELRALFGNLGLAAAAYNAGPQRVKDWIAGRGDLPGETRAYVRIITGSSADEWLHGQQKQPDDLGDTVGPCRPTANATVPSIKMETRREADHEKPSGWGLQLIGNASEINALAEYAQLQIRFRSVLGGRKPIVIKKPLGGRVPSNWFFVKVAESSREQATQLCAKLRSAGGSCLVTPN